MRWERIAPPIIICLLWACAVLPGLPLRSFIWEEGTNAEIARDILSRGDLLRPFIYGIPWTEKPSLLPWLIAGVAAITGEVNEWSARLPAMISVLLTALLVQALTRRYASSTASVFSGLSFLFCPLLLQKLTISEPDTVISFLSFAAFVLWWNGTAIGETTILRWLGCGGLLAALSLTKGPQPVGFFALGVTLYIIVGRRWRDLPGLFVCLALPVAAILAWTMAVYQPGLERTWLNYMRFGAGTNWSDYLAGNLRTVIQLALELLPSLILLPFVPWPWPRNRVAEDIPPVVAPLILYSCACTIVLLFWPSALSRYAMPIAPAVAVLAGIAWDSLEKTKYFRLRWLTNGLVVALVIYQLLLVSVIMPLFADRFGETRLDGEMIERTIRANPAPAFCKSQDTAQPDTNQLFYMRAPIRCLDQKAMESIQAPAWLVARGDILAGLARSRPDLDIRLVVETRTGDRLIAARLEKR